MLRAMLIGGTCLLAVPATAHHGFGTYDLNADIAVSGVLVGLDFVNPHSWLHVETEEIGPDGEPVTFHCEMRAATVLRRSGWSKEMFTVGDAITVNGAPDRRHPNGCYVGTVTFADGSSIDRYGQITLPEEQHDVDRAARRPDGKPNFAGDWTAEQSVMTDPRGIEGALVPLSVAEELDGELPPGVRPFPGSRGADPSLQSFSGSPVELTAMGREAADSYDDLSRDDNPRLRCEATSILFDWTFDQPIHRIAQTDDTLTIEYGDHGLVRTIHIGMEDHPDDLEPSRAGHSIAEWDGDVLVVDTVGFAPGLLTPPVHHGEKLHVTERFSLDPATGGLRRRFQVTDPDYFFGAYAGSDLILPSALPFADDPCLEPDFRGYNRD